MRAHFFIAAGLLNLIAACASPTTLPPTVSQPMVEAERKKQFDKFWQDKVAGNIKLGEMARPLLRAAMPFCPDDLGYDFGYRIFRNLPPVDRGTGFFQEQSETHDFIQAATRRAYGNKDYVAYIVLPSGPAAKAGLKEGDEIISLNGTLLKNIKRNQDDISYQQLVNSKTGSAVNQLKIRRTDGTEQEITITGEKLCNYKIIYEHDDDEQNAFADGKRVVVAGGLRRVASDDHLRYVVAHEIAHNVMMHNAAKKQNAGVGTMMGLLGEGLLSIAVGAPVQTNLAEYGAYHGLIHNSVEFEKEADYVGMYILARAGYSLDGVEELWRQFASREPDTLNPDQKDYETTHPAYPERASLLQRVREEISRKKQRGEELLPTNFTPQRRKKFESAPADQQGLN